MVAADATLVLVLQLQSFGFSRVGDDPIAVANSCGKQGTSISAVLYLGSIEKYVVVLACRVYPGACLNVFIVVHR